MKTNAIDGWLSLANSVIEGEKLRYKSHTTTIGVSPSNPADNLRNLELVVDAGKVARGRNAALARLKELTIKCKTEAHCRLERSEFAEVSRDLDNVVTAIAEFQRWDDMREISKEAVNTLGCSFNLFNLAPVYRGRFQPRLEAVEAAIKSDALESFRFVAGLPAQPASTQNAKAANAVADDDNVPSKELSQLDGQLNRVSRAVLLAMSRNEINTTLKKLPGEKIARLPKSGLKYNTPMKEELSRLQKAPFMFIECLGRGYFLTPRGLEAAKRLDS